MNRLLIYFYTFFLLLFLVFLVAPRIKAQGQGRVGLVVQFGNGTVFTKCVSISEEPFSGYDTLLNSTHPIIARADPMGFAVCSIGNEGCPEDNCLLCDPQYRYWSYWHLGETGWVYSQIGAGSYTVSDGDVEGWRWGLGHPPDQTIPFNQICTDIPTPTSTLTATPTPSPTLSSKTSPSPSPTQTPPPTPISYQNIANNWVPSSTPIATLVPESASPQQDSQTHQIWLPAVIALEETPILSAQAVFTLPVTSTDSSPGKTPESSAKTSPEQSTPIPTIASSSAVTQTQVEPLNKPGYLVFIGMVMGLGVILTIVMLPKRS